MESLRVRFLRYLLAPVGLLVTLGMVPVILRGAESAPTTVAVGEVTSDIPRSHWLRITGGGLSLPLAVEDDYVGRRSRVRTTDAWYVPLLPGAAATPGDNPLVLVRLEPDEFQQYFPDPNSFNPADAFRATEVQGTRMSHAAVPDRAKAKVNASLGVPIERVVLIRYGGAPVGRGPAGLIALGGIGVACVGIAWNRRHWRRAALLPPRPRRRPMPDGD
jgi:hypothetical protein